METSSVCNSDITFGAKPVIKASVLKKVAEGINEFVPKEAQIVELSYSNPHDAEALAVLKNKWVNGRLTEVICSPSNIETRKVYALTAQNSDFEKIDSSKILGLADVDIKDGNATMRFLQAAPEFVDNSKRSVRNVGLAMVRGLIEKFRADGLASIDLFSEQKLKPFYKKVSSHFVDKPSTMESSTNLVLYLREPQKNNLQTELQQITYPIFG